MRALGAFSCLLLLSAAGAATAAPVPVMLLPFGEDDEERKKLFDAIELELELSEDVLMSPGAGLFEELGTRDISERGKEQIADALTYREQMALIYPIFPEDQTKAVMVLFRADDAAVVFAKEVVIQDAAWKPREQVVDPMLAVVRELRAAPAIPEEELVALGVRKAKAQDPADPAEPGDPEGGEGEGEGEPTETGAEGEAEGPGESHSSDDGEPPPGADRIGRVAFSYAPTLLNYRACNPGAAGPTPFLCEPGVASGVTDVLVNPLQSPVGFAASAEAFAFGVVGVVLDANVFYASLLVSDDDGRVDAVFPNPFETFGGNVTAAAAARGSFGFGIIGLSVGGRAGYNLGFAVSSNTTFNGAEFTILPTWYSHRGLLGAEVLLGIGPWARLYSELDLLFGYHAEGRTQVGADPFGFGGRLQAGVDIGLFGGVFLRAGLDTSAFNVNTTGAPPGDVRPRQTFAGDTFSDGQVRIVDLRGVLGLGYQY